MAKTRTSKANGCKCIESVNEKLKEHNAALATQMSFNFETRKGSLVLPVATRKYDSSKKGKVPTLFGSYCPFCGKKNPE